MLKTALSVDRTSNATDLELRVLELEIPSTQEQEHKATEYEGFR